MAEGSSAVKGGQKKINEKIDAKVNEIIAGFGKLKEGKGAKDEMLSLLCDRGMEAIRKARDSGWSAGRIRVPPELNREFGELAKLLKESGKNVNVTPQPGKPYSGFEVGSDVPPPQKLVERPVAATSPFVERTAPVEKSSMDKVRGLVSKLRTDFPREDLAGARPLEFQYMNSQLRRYPLLKETKPRDRTHKLRTERDINTIETQFSGFLRDMEKLEVLKSELGDEQFFKIVHRGAYNSMASKKAEVENTLSRVQAPEMKAPVVPRREKPPVVEAPVEEAPVEKAPPTAAEEPTGELKEDLNTLKRELTALLMRRPTLAEDYLWALDARLQLASSGFVGLSPGKRMDADSAKRKIKQIEDDIANFQELNSRAAVLMASAAKLDMENPAAKIARDVHSSLVKLENKFKNFGAEWEAVLTYAPEEIVVGKGEKAPAEEGVPAVEEAPQAPDTAVLMDELLAERRIQNYLQSVPGRKKARVKDALETAILREGGPGPLTLECRSKAQAERLAEVLNSYPELGISGAESARATLLFRKKGRRFIPQWVVELGDQRKFGEPKILDMVSYINYRLHGGTGVQTSRLEKDFLTPRKKARYKYTGRERDNAINLYMLVMNYGRENGYSASFEKSAGGYVVSVTMPRRDEDIETPVFPPVNLEPEGSYLSAPTIPQTVEEGRFRQWTVENSRKYASVSKKLREAYNGGTGVSVYFESASRAKRAARWMKTHGYSDVVVDEYGYEVSRIVLNRNEVVVLPDFDRQDYLARSKKNEPLDAVAKARYAETLRGRGMLDGEHISSLVNHLTPAQFDGLFAYADGTSETLELSFGGLDVDMVAGVRRAVTELFERQGYLPPHYAYDETSGSMSISAYSRPQPIKLPQEYLGRLGDWDESNYMTDDEKRALVQNFDWEVLDVLMRYADYAYGELIGGDTPAAMDVVIPVQEGLSRKALSAVNSLFLSRGLSVAFGQEEGGISFTIPTRYTRPGVLKFSLPAKIGSMLKGEAKKTWLNTDDPDLGVTGRRNIKAQFAAVSDAVNASAREGAAVQSVSLRSARRAQVVVAYLREKGIAATLDGEHVVIPPGAYKVGKLSRKPPLIPKAPAVKAAPAKKAAKGEKPSKAGKKARKVAPAGIVAKVRAMPAVSGGKRLDTGISELLASSIERRVAIELPCASVPHAHRVRDYLISAGVSPEQVKVSTRRIKVREELPEGGWFTRIEEESTIKYMPLPEKELPLSGLPQREGVTRFSDPQIWEREKEQINSLWEQSFTGAVDAFNKANKDIRATVLEYPDPNLETKLPDPYYTHNTVESGLGDAASSTLFQFATRGLNRQTHEEPLVGAYEQYRKALPKAIHQEKLPDGSVVWRADDPLSFAEVNLAYYSGPGKPRIVKHGEGWVSRPYARDRRKLARCWEALTTRFKTLEELYNEVGAADAIKIEGAADAYASHMMLEYAEEARTPELRQALKYMGAMMAVMTTIFEASPATFGEGDSGKTPQDNLEGALLSFRQTFNYEGRDYMLLSRLLVASGNPEVAYVTVPTKSPDKVTLVGWVERVDLEHEGRKVPAWRFVPLAKKDVVTYSLREGDSLGGNQRTKRYLKFDFMPKLKVEEVPQERVPPPAKKRKKKAPVPVEEEGVRYRMTEYDMAYTPVSIEEGKWRGKNPLPRLEVLVSTQDSEGEISAPPKERYLPELRLDYTVISRIGRPKDADVERYAVLTKASESMHSGEMLMRHRKYKVRNVAELSNDVDRNIYLYRIGRKIMDAKLGSEIFESEEPKVRVGTKTQAGVKSEFEGFSDEELTSLALGGYKGLSVDESGGVYLSIEQEKIGTYDTIAPTKEQGEQISVYVDADKGQYRDMVSSSIGGKELSSSKRFSEDPDEAGHWIFTIPLSANVRGLGPEIYYASGTFSGPAKYRDLPLIPLEEEKR